MIDQAQYESGKLAIGRRIYEDPSLRTDSLYEAMCVREYAKQIKREKLAAEGCCGDKPIQGFCYACICPCPRDEEIHAAVEFCNRFITWMEQLSNSETVI